MCLSSLWLCVLHQCIILRHIEINLPYIRIHHWQIFKIRSLALLVMFKPYNVVRFQYLPCNTFHSIKRNRRKYVYWIMNCLTVKHYSSAHLFWPRVAKSLVSYLVLLWIILCLFVIFRLVIVLSVPLWCLMYGFWIPLWYLQNFRVRLCTR